MELVTCKSECKKTAKDVLIISPKLIKTRHKSCAPDYYIKKKPSHTYLGRTKKMHLGKVLLTEAFFRLSLN